MLNRYTSDNDIDYIEEDYPIEFLTKNNFDSFGDLFFEVSQCGVKNVRTCKKTKVDQLKLISYISQQIMDFPSQKKNEIKTFVSKKFFDSILNLIFRDVVLHHSHIDGKIFRYAHNFCNQKVKENRSAISVIAYN